MPYLEGIELESEEDIVPAERIKRVKDFVLRCFGKKI